MTEFIPILRRSALFKDIPEGEIPALLDRLGARVRQYRRGSFILHYGDRVSSLSIVLSGSAVIFKDDYWGNSSVISKAEPSQSFGVSYALSTGGASEVNVSAEGDTRIAEIPVKSILQEERLTRNLIAVLSDRNIYLSGKIEHISQRRLRDKILSYLSDVSKKKGSTKFEIPFSRKQLADYLNADRSALSNELCKLRDEGVIRFRKNRFELL